MEMLARVGQYEQDHPVTPAIERAAELFADAKGLFVAMQAHNGDQVFGMSGYRAGALERRVLGADLKEFLKDMAATARALEPKFPGISEQFRLGRQSDSYAALLGTAHAFLKAVEPAEVKALFVARAFPADLDAQLTAKIGALAAATGRKHSGLQTRKEGSAGLDLLNRRVTETMRELGALMRKHLRDTNPLLLEVWEAAARTYSQPVPSKVSADAVNSNIESHAAPPVSPAEKKAPMANVCVCVVPAANACQEYCSTFDEPQGSSLTVSENRVTEP